MDVIDALRRYGILIPELMVQAALYERVDVAVAATILMMESGGGRNIYGHDPVPTGGHYTLGGPVTRENYLAYRAWMRAGPGRRQGVGPCQCTSAQYQDTADVLGGCWDPLANMRSGFRGMGALIRSYGIEEGARRYNGSGPAAERYGRDFAARVQTWQVYLAGTSPAPPPPVQEDTMTPADNWNYGVTNLNGQIVPASLILSATESRVADLQNKIGDIETFLNALGAAVDPAAMKALVKQAVLDALAAQASGSLTLTVTPAAPAPTS